MDRYGNRCWFGKCDKLAIPGTNFCRHHQLDKGSGKKLTKLIGMLRPEYAEKGAKDD